LDNLISGGIINPSSQQSFPQHFFVTDSLFVGTSVTHGASEFFGLPYRKAGRLHGNPHGLLLK
jgi:hypothetical protein